MLNDHAILLTRDNTEQIKLNTSISDESLEELFQEMLSDDERWYVVFYRTDAGHPTWTVLSDEELMKDYSLTTLEGRFLRIFERVVA